MSEDIPEEIKDFLRRYINSVGQLEILFLLFRDRSRTWSAQQISQEQRTNLSMAERQLEELSRSKLVLLEGGVARCCEDQDQLSIIERVSAFYNLRRAIVIEFIYSQPLDRIRSFADAFKIKKD